MSRTTDSPTFRDLNREEIDEILTRNNVGRMAYARGNQVDIQPLHYVYSDGWIYGRTSVGRKLELTGEKWWPVAFEVDEIEDLFRWRSVIIHGGFYVIHPDGPTPEREEYQRAIGLLRKLIPETRTDDDPTPFRNLVFRIAVQEVTGKAAEPERTTSP